MTHIDTVRAIRDAVQSGARRAVDVCAASLAAIDQQNAALNALTTVVRDRAMERAAAIDRHPLRHTLPLAGVPVAIKDNICTQGVRTTASSRILEHFVPPFSATVVERLEHAGAIVVGKANCDEFAMGSSTETSAFGPTLNPWDPARIPGGTSGGSAVAVASGMTPLALGSDTGGSIRQPAGLCGIVGLKPTYGRVSRYGLIAHASSLDQIGPMTRNVEDAALALSVMAGADPADATSSTTPTPDFAASLRQPGRRLRIGVPRALVESGVEPDVSAAFSAALDTLASQGAAIVDIALPHASAAIPVYYLVSTAEASSNLARYDGVRFGFRAPTTSGERTGQMEDDLKSMYGRTRAQGFGAEVKRRIMLGTYVLSAGYYDAYYLKAQRVRTLIRQDYERAFEQVDVVAVPTSPTAAFRIGEKTSDPLQMYLADVFTVSASLAGLPAISVPCGFTSEHLPIGLQLTGRMWDEATMLGCALDYEGLTSWSTKRPSTD